MSVYANVDKTSLILTILFSFFGLVAGIISYVMFTKWSCCIEDTLFAKIKQKFSKDGKDIDVDDKPPALCSSPALINAISVLQVFGKVLLIVVNAVYLGLVGWDQPGTIDILGTNKSTNLLLAGKSFANLVTFISFVYEIIVIVYVPFHAGCLWTFCWQKQLQSGKGFWNFLEFLRLADLEFALMFAPFSNVNLFYLGKGWYVVLIYRLAFYSITFAAAVIAGVKFIFAIYCCIICECACNSEAVEVRNCKHLMLEVGVKMVVIALKLMTCSSALSTYLSIGILVKSFAFRVAYFSFTLLRGVTAIFSLSFTAVLLRHAVLKEDEKENDNRITKVLNWLSKWEPHTHISFVVDMVTYGGLFALNFIIVYGIVNNQ